MILKEVCHLDIFHSLYLILIAIYGLILGSFYNVVGLRVPAGESIVSPRSACPKCHHTLTAAELIPVVSFMLQRGKCRSCGAKISPLYPAFELLTAFLFTISPLLLGWSKELIVAWTLISLCMIIFVSDMTYMIIPDKVLLVFLPLFIIERIWVPASPIFDPLFGALAGFAVLYGIAWITNGGMGGGDIKLFAVLGIPLGWKLVLLAFLLATFFGAAFGAIGMMIGKVKKGVPFPFGPYIVLGTLIAYYFGHDLLHWYISILKGF